jgi:hypothetical protein
MDSLELCFRLPDWVEDLIGTGKVARVSPTFAVRHLNRGF